jgi:NADH:ubiquinone oxidoreductase subunit 5 (subunit L)/multisubunit Na+/H+ antiporter MnhA subunit
MHHLWLIPAFPLAGFLVNGLFGRRAPKMLVTLVGIGSVLLSFLWVVKTLSALGPMEEGGGPCRAILRLDPERGASRGL